VLLGPAAGFAPPALFDALGCAAPAFVEEGVAVPLEGGVCLLLLLTQRAEPAEPTSISHRVSRE
jgi:hypothetical protein